MKKLKIISYILTILLSISSCRKDPCESKVCKNGGTCDNGTCNCPSGYTGSDCGTEKTPSSVTITKIFLINYPMTDGNGAGWDFAAGPDVFLSINQGTASNDVQTSGVATDVTGGSITFDNNFPYTITAPSVDWAIGVWDYDSPDPNDFMGGVYFTPNNYKGGFPSTINLSAGSVGMTLYVTWNF